MQSERNVGTRCVHPEDPSAGAANSGDRRRRAFSTWVKTASDWANAAPGPFRMPPPQGGQACSRWANIGFSNLRSGWDANRSRERRSSCAGRSGLIQLQGRRNQPGSARRTKRFGLALGRRDRGGRQRIEDARKAPVRAVVFSEQCKRTVHRSSRPHAGDCRPRPERSRTVPAKSRRCARWCGPDGPR